MNASDTAAPHPHRTLWVRLAAGFAIFVFLLVLVLVFFPWDVLRGPLNRYVSERTGRHFEITRKLDVKLGRTTRILADGIQFANPAWARDPQLVTADSAEIQLSLLPLLRRQIEMPLVILRHPRLGLQVEADGRRSWALGHDTADPKNLPQIGALEVDEGSVHFVAPGHGADVQTEFSIQAPGAQGAGSSDMPLSFKSAGTWQKERFTAQGRTGNVLYLSEALKQAFPLEVSAVAGETTLRVSGAVSSLATLDGAKVDVNIKGHDLADLYKFFGVVLPATPRYALHGDVTREGDVWHAKNIRGKLGNSDLAGELSFDRSGAVPLLTGNVHSKSLDFDDLAPLVGLPETSRSVAALPEVKGARAAAAVKTAAARGDASRKVLPTAKLDVPRLKAMDADVHYQALRVTNVRHLPLDRVSVHVKMKDGVLLLDPLDMGVAGGSFLGKLRIDGNSDPAIAEVHLAARELELNKLFGGLKLAKASFGKIHGDIELKGRGNSVAQMLGTSGGKVAMLMGRGEISNLLMEFAGIDGGEIIKFYLQGDENVRLRCAAAAFDVTNGLMQSRALVLDTADTVIYGDGQISLASEAMDFTLRPYPKDMSILSLRSPLKVAGSFAAPKIGPEKGALAARGGLVLALAAINPLLGLAATIETGPGKDADCGPALRDAASPYAAARITALSQAAQEKDKDKVKDGGRPAALLGGPAAAAKPASSSPHAPGAPGKLYGP